MYYAHNYEPMTEDKRPQDIYMDGRDWKFETLKHGGEYPDMMPQAIRATDAQGRSCIYIPVMESGKVVDSKGFISDSRKDARVGLADARSTVMKRGLWSFTVFLIPMVLFWLSGSEFERGEHLAWTTALSLFAAAAVWFGPWRD